MSEKQEGALNLYEAMFIFPESVKEDQLDGAVNRARGEIEKLGGRIESTTRLGKRAFARRMKKQQGGHYVVIGFRLAGDQIVALQERYRLTEEVFRVQIHRAAEMDAEAAAGTEGPKDVQP